jgi:hypothetical protein
MGSCTEFVSCNQAFNPRRKGGFCSAPSSPATVYAGGLRCCSSTPEHFEHHDRPPTSAIEGCVALAFMKSDDGGDIVACDPKEARNSEQAIRTASSLAKMEGHCGVIASSRTGDPALGDFDDAVILKTVGELDAGLLSI